MENKKAKQFYFAF